MRHRLLAFCAFLCLLCAPVPVSGAEILRLGLLPIVDTLALHVADREGYFAEQGLDVRLIPFQSALEKDAAVQAGSLDGHFCEIISVIVQQAAGLPYVAVASTSHSNARSRMFGLVTSPGNKARSLDELQGKSIAVAHQTIVAFLTDAFLAQAGKPADFMQRKDIRRIPIRLQMLLANQVDAALFPEPLLSVAEQAGGAVIMDDRILDEPLAVMAFSTAKATPKNIAGFRAAFRKAAAAINADPEKYRPLLLELRLIPPQLKDSYQVPSFPLEMVPHALPSAELFNAYVDWLEKNQVLAAPGEAGRPGALKAPRYEDVVYQGLAAD